MAKRKYRPIADCILLEKLEVEKQTEGGILLPDIVADEIHKGKVIAVGDGMPDVPMFVKPGNTILYYCKRPMTIDEYVLINQRDVFVVVEDEFADEVGVDTAKDGEGETAMPNCEIPINYTSSHVDCDHIDDIKTYN